MWGYTVGVVGEYGGGVRWGSIAGEYELRFLSNTNKAPPRPTIPQFYFPQGNITSTNSKKRISIMIEKLQSVFNNFPNKNQAGKTDWKAMAKAAQCPFYWKTLLARAASPCTEDEIKLSSIDQPTSPAGSSNGSESGGVRKFLRRFR